MCVCSASRQRRNEAVQALRRKKRHCPACHLNGICRKKRHGKGNVSNKYILRECQAAFYQVFFVQQSFPLGMNYMQISQTRCTFYAFATWTLAPFSWCGDENALENLMQVATRFIAAVALLFENIYVVSFALYLKLMKQDLGV